MENGAAKKDITCLLCGGHAVKVADGLDAASSRADIVYPIAMYECRDCAHVQKDAGEQYQKHLDEIYRVSYTLPADGRKINIINGKAVSREKTLAQNLAPFVNKTVKGSVLDVGTGAGYLLSALAAEFSNFEIAAYDLNNEKEAVIRANGATDFYYGDLSAIPKKFDLITLNHVLEHLAKPVAVLKQIAGLLKPDGHVAVVVPCYKYIQTEFYFMEHCSHFTPRSLNVAAALVGLSIVDRLQGKLGSVEIAFVAKRADLDDAVSPAEAIRWSQSLPWLIREQGKERPVGVFGVSGAGMWLAAILKGEIAFIVDDDPLKQGTKLAGCPIIAVKDIPKEAAVVVTYNNPEASLKMCERLKGIRPDIRFIAPPRA